MKRIRVLKEIKASPSLGVVHQYLKDEELEIDNARVTKHIYDWFLHNKLAVVVEDIIESVEKSVEESPENKALEKAPENKAITKTETKSNGTKKGKKKKTTKK